MSTCPVAVCVKWPLNHAFLCFWCCTRWLTHCTLPTGFGRKDVVEFLLGHGAKPDAQDDGGLIPLHNACSFGHSEVVSVLLQHGADPNTRDNWNYTPLHEAAHKGKVAVCIRK